MKERISRALEEIKKKGNYRFLRYIKPVSESKIVFHGKELLNLCSNNYLSLQYHPKVLEAMQEILRHYGSGTCSSRSVSGNIDLYEMVEEKIASYKGYPKGLMFSNGYMANIGIISTLTEKGDVIFSDELNHSSLIHSMRLSRAKKVVYRHRDANDLEKKLKREKAAGEKFIVTESVFSMDGDIAELKAIYDLKERFDARVIIDDAHGTAVFGKHGTGVEEVFDLAGKMDVHMGTFGKALGSFGAFVLADPIILEYLVNRAKTFMYTTALPASCLVASAAAIDIVREDASYKEALWDNILYMRSALATAGFDMKESMGPIVPIVVGEDALAVKMQGMLMEKGIFLQAIRPPTVPEGTSRLRLTIVRGLTKEEMDYALDAIVNTGKHIGLI